MTKVVQCPLAGLELLGLEQLFCEQHHLPQMRDFWFGDSMLFHRPVLEQRGASYKLEHLDRMVIKDVHAG